MVAYTALQSENHFESVLKGVISGLGIWCGLGLLKRKGQVLWFTVGLCLYAIYGSMVWLYQGVLLPLLYGKSVSYGFYDFLGIFYIVVGSLVIWFLLHERTRRYFEKHH